uniref:Uncharacterized protein n=1 Tax=Globodera rostochiensis TaxID=31243 RepID=A0A914HXX1_GLORO
MDKFDKVRLNERNYDLVRNLHMNWYAGGIKALMGKLGKDLFKILLPAERSRLAECLNGIEDKKDLVLSANCLINSRKTYFLRTRQVSSFKKKNESFVHSAKSLVKKRAIDKEQIKSVGKFELSERIKRLGRTAKNKVAKRAEVRQADVFENLSGKNDRSAIIRVSNLISKLTNGGNNGSVGGVRWTKMFDSLVQLKKANDKRRQSPGAAVYEKRMYDLVLDKKEPSLGPKAKLSPEGLLRQGISLLQKLHNETVHREESTNYKFMSPRFAPLMPDQSKAGKSVLSPTVFALYETDKSYGSNGTKGQQAKGLEIASIPEVLKAAGLKQQDREALLQTLMEVSGTIGHANDRILTAYTKMEKSFEREQETELEKDGWTFIKRKQFDQLCKDQYAEFPDDLKAKLDDFDELDKARREESVWKRIERIARNIPDEIADKLDKRRRQKFIRLHLSDKNRRRMKRQSPNETGPKIYWLSVLKPIVLEPYMFTPIYGLSVLGPLILSPNIFSPLILAPSVLGPWILSPAAPVPFILSPYVFGPFILSPMAMAPFILTPYVLSPNVLNPFAMSPLILSPTVLSPDILSPQILGGGILSPTVGSPAVLTESALMASVLSPSVLSK